MDTREFLEAVWPTQGNFCLAVPYLVEGAKKATYSHIVVNSLDEAVKRINWKKQANDIFFAVHTLKQPFVTNPNKIDRKTGLPGGKEYRTHANMLESKAFFFDLDVGPEEKKYQTREDAIGGLESFLFHTGLPEPLVASSGGGYHVYWLVSDPIPSSIWRGHAAKLYHLARQLGLRVDPARTTDHSSVLRVAGTFNHKHGGKRPVVVVGAGAVTPTADFIAALDTLVGDAEINLPNPVQAAVDILGSNTDRNYDGPVPTLTEVSNVCEHVADFVLGADIAGNSEWYNVGAGVIQYVEDGVERALELAAEHPGRLDHADTDIARWAASFGPASCAKVDAACGGDACARCPLKSLGGGPVSIAIKARKHAPAPALQPAMQLATPAATTLSAAPPTTVCPCPPPYARVTGGIDETWVTDKKVITKIIVPYDFWPYASFGKTELEPAFSMWSAGIWLPNPLKQDPAPTQQVLVKVPTNVLVDLRLLHVHLSNHGLHVAAGMIVRVREYMLAYIRSLQAYQKANMQYDHLGWADIGRTTFIMPTMAHSIDGTTQPCTLSALAKPALSLVGRAGTQVQQFAALQFYNHEKYIPHQFAIGCALASIVLYGGTRYHGGVVALVGDTSASKSTALAAAASLWGRPEEYVVNGTNRGATVTAKEDQVLTLANLPSIVDEITEMPDQDAKDFVFASTQAKPRIRCYSDGTLRPARVTLKSLITIVSANKSIHHLLEQNNAAGTAASMRALEINMLAVPDDPAEKARADQFLRDVADNHGHIGPAFLEFYIANRDLVDETVQKAIKALDVKYKLRTAERYWTGIAATVLICLGFAYDLGLLPYAPKPVNDWVFEFLIPDNRGIVMATSATKAPNVLIMDFLNSIVGDIIVSDLGGANLFNTPDRIAGHWDVGKGVMYVSRAVFKSWCGHRPGCNHNDLLRQLNRIGIVTAIDKKVTLGAGTPMAQLGRTLCFMISLKHPLIAAQVPVLAPPATVTKLPAKQATP